MAPQQSPLEELTPSFGIGSDLITSTATGVEILPPLGSGSVGSNPNPNLMPWVVFCASPTEPTTLDWTDYDRSAYNCVPVGDGTFQLAYDVTGGFYAENWKTQKLDGGWHILELYTADPGDGGDLLGLATFELICSGGGNNCGRNEPVKVYIDELALCALVFPGLDITGGTSATCATASIPNPAPSTGATLTGFQDPNNPIVPVVNTKFTGAWISGPGADQYTVTVICYDADEYAEAFGTALWPGQGPADGSGNTATWGDPADGRWMDQWPVVCDYNIDPLPPAGFVQGQVEVEVCPVDEDFNADFHPEWPGGADADIWIGHLKDDGTFVVPPTDPGGNCGGVVWEPTNLGSLDASPTNDDGLWGSFKGRLAAVLDWATPRVSERLAAAIDFVMPQPLKAAIAAVRHASSSFADNFSLFFNVEAAVIHGSVFEVDASGTPVGNPVSGATVNLYPIDQVGGSPLASKTTTSSGMYSFTQLPCSLEAAWADGPGGGDSNCVGMYLDYRLEVVMPSGSTLYPLQSTKEVCLYSEFTDGEFESPPTATTCGDPILPDPSTYPEGGPPDPAYGNRSDPIQVDFGAAELGFDDGFEVANGGPRTGFPVGTASWTDLLGGLSWGQLQPGPFWDDSQAGTCAVTTAAAGNGASTEIAGWLGKNNEHSFMVFRRIFSVPQAAVDAGVELFLQTKHADDVIVFLNGENITRNIVGGGALAGVHTSANTKSTSSGGANTGGKPEKHNTSGVVDWLGEDAQQHAGCPPAVDWDVTYSNGSTALTTTNTLHVVVGNRDGKVSYFKGVGVVQ